MRENAFSPLFIFAFNLQSEKEDVAELYRLGVEFFTICQGCYKGKIERSYLVSAHHFEKVRPVLSSFNQESVLFLDNQRSAWLLKREDDYRHSFNSVYLGEFRAIAKTQAAGKEAWTKIGDNYFVAG